MTGSSTSTIPKIIKDEKTLPIPARIALEFDFSIDSIRNAYNSKGHFKHASDLIEYLEDRDTYNIAHNVDNDENYPCLSPSSRVTSQCPSADEQNSTVISPPPVTTESVHLVSDLIKETARLHAKQFCYICHKNRREILLLPCSEFLLCATCEVNISHCPHCLEPIRDVIRVYLA